MSYEGEAAAVGNQFDRLPDDVVVRVFDHLIDAKWLCRSSMVCERFSLLIPRVRTVSASFPNWKLPSRPKLPKRIFNFFVAKPFHKLLSSATTPSPSPSSPLESILKFLSQIRGIETLHLDLPPSSNIPASNPDSVFKWGAKFGARRLESFTFLSLASLRRQMSEDEDENGSRRRLMNREKESHRAASLSVHLYDDALRWQDLLVAFVPRLPMLSSFSIADTKGWGMRMCVSGERLVRLRESLNSMTLDDLCKDSGTKLQPMACHVPLLRLPNSGYVVEGPTLVFADCGGGGGGGGDDEGVLIDSFAVEEEEERVYGEAVAEMLKVLNKHCCECC